MYNVTYLQQYVASSVLNYHLLDTSWVYYELNVFTWESEPELARHIKTLLQSESLLQS